MRAKYCCFLCIWKLKVGGEAWEFCRVVYVYLSGIYRELVSEVQI
jgi:hypothetical protein